MSYNQPTVVVAPQPQQQVVSTSVIVQEKQPNPCRAAIPSMHIAAAVTCLILNIFFPGIGTIVAGFAVFCCGNPGQSDGGKFGTFCLNFWVGLLQLALTLIFFIGWIWAIVWGAIMVGLSAEYHNPKTTTTVIQTQQEGQVVTTHPGQPIQTYNQPPPQQWLPQQQQPQPAQYPPTYNAGEPLPPKY